MAQRPKSRKKRPIIVPRRRIVKIEAMGRSRVHWPNFARVLLIASDSRAWVVADAAPDDADLRADIRCVPRPTRLAPGRRETGRSVDSADCSGGAVAVFVGEALHCVGVGVHEGWEH